MRISDRNQKPVFKIDKVVLFSSADAIDNTQEKSLKDLDISQFTDIAISINNTAYIPDLTQENTVKALRIDDIEILSDQETGIKSLTYKNRSNFARLNFTDASNVYTSPDTFVECAPIDFKILYTNDEKADYSTPTFFTDCSDDITLGFINKNVVSHYAVPDNNNVSFSGTMLRQANVDMAALTSKINFKITLTNNLDQNFIYNVKLNLSFDDQSSLVQNGYAYQGRESSEGKAYNFYRAS